MMECHPPPVSHYSHPLSIRMNAWREAEERVEEMLYVFQPTVISQDRRNEVIEYVQTVIGSYIGAELFPFGSMPLRTYLPDGDIDLTILCNPSAVDDLIRRICMMVDDRCNDREFQIKDVRIVEAQVKILKFMVKDIAVDLSFNQVAGIGALCFLEQVNQLIGRDHLLKRSIILIKAWCLYESRILGAHNGLISTYCLEIMVLHIINVFNSSLNGPLAVLYKFLDYFGKFDWQNHCLSVHGPVPLSSLPTTIPCTAESPESKDNNILLLGRDFIDACKELFCSPILEMKPRPFQVKYLNVVDPLKVTNNLGRSVSKGNFFRIKYAFSYGAQKLGEILMLPMGGRMSRELENFFRNTLDRNGRGERPDVEDVVVPAFGTGRFATPSLDGEINTCYSNLMYSQWQFGCCGRIAFDGQSSDGRRWDALRKFVSQRGTDVFVPGLCPIQPCAPRIEEPVGRPKGTGTFIPIVQNRSPLRRSQVWPRSRKFREPCIVAEPTRRSSPTPRVKLKGRCLPEEVELGPIIWGPVTVEEMLEKIELEEEDDEKNSNEIMICRSLAKPYQLQDKMDFPPLSDQT